MAQLVKNPPANAGNASKASSIPGMRRPPEGGNGNHSSILAWRIPWTEEPGGATGLGVQSVGQD